MSEDAEMPYGELYGIKHSNRENDALWGKNQFNSTFPLALACYMRDKKIPVVYLTLKNDLTIEAVELSIDELFGTKQSSDDLYFSFETAFNPYASLAYDSIERVDLVISEKAEKATGKKTKIIAGEHLAALEVKLTVVPDNTTHAREEKYWAPELVVRPATTMYCALSMGASCASKITDIKDIFEPICHSVKSWGNETEALKLLPQALDGIDQFQKKFHSRQRPAVMQPIWRTQGKKPVLSEHAFDIFVWSDFALTRVIADLARKGKHDSISRHSRSSLRLARFLFEYSRSGKAHLSNIYSEMTYSHQSDKEVSLSGNTIYPYMKHPRLEKPILSREVVKEIILNGGERHLSPERRFDQTVYFSSQS